MLLATSSYAFEPSFLCYRHLMTWGGISVRPYTAVEREQEARRAAKQREAGTHTRPPFQLNVSTFCGIRWVASVCQ